MCRRGRHGRRRRHRRPRVPRRWPTPSSPRATTRVAVTCDVTQRAPVDAMVAEAAATRADRRARARRPRSRAWCRSSELGDDEWQHVLDVNLKGPFLCMRAAIPHMVGAGGGSVIAHGLDARADRRARPSRLLREQGRAREPLQAGRDRARARQRARQPPRAVGDDDGPLHEALGAAHPIPTSCVRRSRRTCR